MSFVIPVALQIHFFSKNENDAGYMQKPNRTLLPMTVKIARDFANNYNRPTLYDSFYLAVAKEIESELWAADRKLINSLNNEIPWVKSIFEQ